MTKAEADRGLTQQQMADKIGMHVSQLKRDEAGSSQPTIEVFRRIAVMLSVSADVLLFEDNERGPDEQFKLPFEALSQLDDKEREVVKTVIAGILHMHDAKRWTQTHDAAPVVEAKAGAKSRKAGGR